MPYIDIKNNEPGIAGLFKYSPDVEIPMRLLAEKVLRRGVLTQSVAELIAAYVSYKNKCEFCYASHLEAFKASAIKFDDTRTNELAQSLIADTIINDADVWLRSALMLADQVRRDVKPTQEMIDYCKMNGMCDEELHDVILITATFCMFNRYVDGLDTIKATEEQYKAMGKAMIENGYVHAMYDHD